MEVRLRSRRKCAGGENATGVVYGPANLGTDKHKRRKFVNVRIEPKKTPEKSNKKYKKKKKRKTTNNKNNSIKKKKKNANGDEDRTGTYIIIIT